MQLSRSKSLFVLLFGGVSLFFLRRLFYRYFYWNRSRQIPLGTNIPSVFKSFIMLLTIPKSGLYKARMPSIELNSDFLKINQTSLRSFLNLFGYPQRKEFENENAKAVRIPTGFLQTWYYFIFLYLLRFL
jgi:hypothetical protein